MTRLNKRPVLALIATAVLALLLVPGAGASSDSVSIAAESKHAQLPIVIGHRGRQRLPARAHPGLLRAGDRDGRRLHRARPGLDQGPRARRAPRERHHRDHRRRRPPRVRRPQDDQDRSTASRSRAGSPRTSPSPSCKTLRAKERLPDVRPANTAFDGLYQIPTFQEVIDLAKRRRRRHLPGDQAPDLLPLDRPAARGAAGRDAARQRLTAAATRRCSSSPSRSATCKRAATG